MGCGRTTCRMATASSTSPTRPAARRARAAWAAPTWANSSRASGTAEGCGSPTTALGGTDRSSRGAFRIGSATRCTAWRSSRTRSTCTRTSFTRKVSARCLSPTWAHPSRVSIRRVAWARWSRRSGDPPPPRAWSCRTSPWPRPRAAGLRLRLRKASSTVTTPSPSRVRVMPAATPAPSTRKMPARSSPPLEASLASRACRTTLLPQPASSQAAARWTSRARKRMRRRLWRSSASRRT
mmetsp:Transcript_12139/g.32619  ORF Transcript_12139/g.32619 Transcript_12139/m.32619 type:complete len:238 (-) Transcript_12139:1085-1798(-)